LMFEVIQLISISEHSVPGSITSIYISAIRGKTLSIALYHFAQKYKFVLLLKSTYAKVRSFVIREV
jgi:hypothetical protein